MAIIHRGLFVFAFMVSGRKFWYIFKYVLLLKQKEICRKITSQVFCLILGGKLNKHVWLSAVCCLVFYHYKIHNYVCWKKMTIKLSNLMHRIIKNYQLTNISENKRGNINISNRRNCIFDNKKCPKYFSSVLISTFSNCGHFSCHLSQNPKLGDQ